MSAEKIEQSFRKFVGGIEKALDDGWKPGQKIPSWLEARVSEVGEAVKAGRPTDSGFTPAETVSDTDTEPAETETANEAAGSGTSDESTCHYGSEDQSSDQANASI